MTIFEELKKRDENMAEDRFRQAAREGQILFNACAHAQLIEVIGQAGWDSVLIDQQHGLGGHDEMVACLTAAKAAGMPTLVRVADNDPGLVGPALAGAEGVVCPLIIAPRMRSASCVPLRILHVGTAAGVLIAHSSCFRELRFAGEWLDNCLSSNRDTRPCQLPGWPGFLQVDPELGGRVIRAERAG